MATTSASGKGEGRARATRRLAIPAALVAVLLIAGGIAVYLLWPRSAPSAAPSVTVAAVEASIQPVAPASALVATAPPATALQTQQVGDWAVVCPVSSTDRKDCFLQQQLRTREQKQIVLVWTIRKDSAGIVHAVWEVPADVVHERGMVIDLADGKPKGLAFSSCTDQTCTARAVLAPDYLQSIEAAARIDAAVSATGKTDPVRFTLSSAGLSQALGILSRN